LAHSTAAAVAAALLLLAVACSSSDRQDGGDAPARLAVADDWTADYNQMVETLKLSPEDSGRLKSAFETRQQAIVDWMSANGDRLSDLEGEMAAAARARNLSEVDRIKSQAQPLRDELRGLIAARQQAVREALSPPQRAAWEGHQLAERILKLMTTLSLSADQVAAIRQEAVAAARAAATETNPQAAGFLQLERGVEARVLTAQQRTAYEGIKKKNPLRSLRQG
jgi:hypothetical protein